ncbi:phage tail protein I [Sphingomonas sp.]|uniref:phage tail protein I n=1 Tax=Sphingomonas sp. TaxID=28214 RepID=UPI003B3AA221
MTSLLPPNSSALERAREQATARIGDVPVRLPDLWNPATCPAPLLPWLAWTVSIDNWEPTWPDVVKRARVAQAISVQRRKGTVSAVRDVVSAFGGAIAMREWWQTVPQGAPHTFDLVLSLANQNGAPPSAAYLANVIAEIALTKPARSHFSFTQAIAAGGAIGVTGAARAATYARLQLAAPAA